MFARVIKSYRNVAIFCDEDLIGKNLEEGGFKLDVKENFYKGDSVSVQRAREIMNDMSREDATFNIVGEEAINTAIEIGIIDPESVKKIQGIPYAMVLL